MALKFYGAMMIEESGVDQLINKIKTQAIEEASVKASAIIDEANKKARTILSAAEHEVKQKLDDLDRIIESQKQKLQNELSLAARDFVGELHQKLCKELTFQAISDHIRADLKEPDFLKEVLYKIILTAVKEESIKIEIFVPKEMRTMIAAYFAGLTFDSLKHRPNIFVGEHEQKSGFYLKKEGQNFFWDFSSETISLEIAKLVEPNLRKYFLSGTKTNNERQVIDREAAAL